MTTLQINVTYPEIKEISRAMARLEKLLDDEIEILERRIEPAIENWSAESRPKWIKRGANYPRLSSRMQTTSEPFIWVHEGTSHGRVSFSKDYRPMTKPRSLRSRPRSGRVVKRGYGAGLIRGIAPRKFLDVAIEQREKPFRKKTLNKLDVTFRQILGRSNKTVKWSGKIF
jgi:hypothetical protein